ncbi:hypothetical protein Cgig2_014884 [Carnegiea gigantea]|uniref:Uncharacterized protein n=1 Tax=Carnegiea gigantea TaxID=171969 RepID=A0A9Q1GSC9_9CARY|nr:hypothetical protein Cgig2_014884 [Carnegiea gigantea]
MQFTCPDAKIFYQNAKIAVRTHWLQTLPRKQSSTEISREVPASRKNKLIYFLNLGTSTACPSRGCVIIHGTTHVTTSSLVHLGNDGVADALKLLHLVLKLIGLSQLVRVEPLDGAVNGILYLLLVCLGKLGTNLLILDIVLSSAETFRIPLASMSKQTLIWGTPLGAGGMPESSNLPSKLLSRVRVEKTCSFLVGMVVFLGIKTVMTPPAVSKPRDRGVTSSNKRSWTFSFPSPLKMAACTAAPYATASSGLMLLHSSLPLKKSCNSCWTLGILVDPPTRTTSCTVLLSILASLKHFSTGSIHFLNKSMFNSSKRARVMVGPLRPFTSCSQPPKSPRVATDVLLVLSLELLDKVVHHSVVKVLTTKMGVPSGGFHLKDTFLNGEQGDIKGTPTEIKDQDVLLTSAGGLLVKTIGNGSSGWLINDTHNIQARNDSSILCGLTLRVIELQALPYVPLAYQKTKTQLIQASNRFTNIQVVVSN